jgi:hypothetical protein
LPWLSKYVLLASLAGLAGNEAYFSGIGYFDLVTFHAGFGSAQPAGLVE